MLDLGLDRLIARGYLAQRQATTERATARRLCERFALLARAMPARRPTATEAMVVHSDATGAIVALNHTAAEWLNVPAARLVGMRLLHFVSRSHTRTFRGIVKGLGYPGCSPAATVAFRPREGRPRLVHASVEKQGPNRYVWTLRLAD
jgi:PAS domain-containing protein